LRIIGLEGKQSARMGNEAQNQQNPCHPAQKKAGHCAIREHQQRLEGWRTKLAQSGHYPHHGGAKQLPTALSRAKLEALPSLSNLAMSTDSVKDILARAKQRAEAMKLPYAGALLPLEAHALMQNIPGAKLVDVRTQAEWEYVGHIPESVLIEWNSFPSGQRNPQFLEQLQARVAKTEAPVMFLCRSGARSHQAAVVATQAGYPNSYNILEGFEGDKDGQSHRNSVGGWRVAGLPWIQG
jgi:rhodanese-related sulfurtransferase